jgi:predicted small metal-binding protein
VDQLLAYKAMSKHQQTKLTNDYVSKHAQEIEKVLQRAVNHALLTHKRLGNPIAVWRDDHVVVVPPEEITISPDDSEPQR